MTLCHKAGSWKMSSISCSPPQKYAEKGKISHGRRFYEACEIVHEPECRVTGIHVVMVACHIGNFHQGAFIVIKTLWSIRCQYLLLGFDSSRIWRTKKNRSKVVSLENVHSHYRAKRAWKNLRPFCVKESKQIDFLGDMVSGTVLFNCHTSTSP